MAPLPCGKCDEWKHMRVGAIQARRSLAFIKTHLLIYRYVILGLGIVHIGIMADESLLRVCW